MRDTELPDLPKLRKRSTHLFLYLILNTCSMCEHHFRSQLIATLSRRREEYYGRELPSGPIITAWILVRLLSYVQKTAFRLINRQRWTVGQAENMIKFELRIVM